MAEREYERDDAGKFSATGGGAGKEVTKAIGERLRGKQAAQIQRLHEAKKSTPEGAAPKVGRKELRPGVTFYSFGKDPGEVQLQSWDLGSTADDPTGTKNPLGSHISNIATGFLPGKSDAKESEIGEYVTKTLKLGDLKAPPGHEIVYRIAGSADGLSQKNAGSLLGVLAHAADSEEKGSLYGTTLTAYAVRLPKTFESYEYLRQQGKQ